MAKPGNVLTNVSGNKGFDELAELLNELVSKTHELYCEQQITNLHLAVMSGEEFSKEELE